MVVNFPIMQLFLFSSFEHKSDIRKHLAIQFSNKVKIVGVWKVEIPIPQPWVLPEGEVLNDEDCRGDKVIRGRKKPPSGKVNETGYLKN